MRTQEALGMVGVAVACSIVALAQEFEITSFDHNGSLSWSNISTAALCHVEWASSLASSNWSRDWRSARSIPGTNAVGTARVPMFYRVICSTNEAFRVLPTASIQIDGDNADWTSVAPLMADPTNDQDAAADFAGTDIQYFYLAKDTNFLYASFRLYDGDPRTNENTMYNFMVKRSAQPDLQPQDNLIVCGSVEGSWCMYVKVLSSVGEGGIGIYPQEYVGASTNFGARGFGWLELKVPLSDLALDERYITTIYTHSPGAGGTNPVSDACYQPVKILFP